MPKLARSDQTTFDLILLDSHWWNICFGWSPLQPLWGILFASCSIFWCRRDLQSSWKPWHDAKLNGGELKLEIIPLEGLTPTSTLAAWHSEVAASLKVSQDDQVMSSGQKILRQVQSYVLFFKENICIEKYLQVLRWDSAHFRFPTPFLSSQLRKRVEGRIAWSAVSLSAPSKHTWKKRQVSRTRVRIVSSAHLSSQEEIIKSPFFSRRKHLPK